MINLNLKVISQSIIHVFKNSNKFKIEKSVNHFRYSYQFKSMLILRASGKGIVAEGYIRMLES